MRQGLPPRRKGETSHDRNHHPALPVVPWAEVVNVDEPELIMCGHGGVSAYREFQIAGHEDAGGVAVEQGWILVDGQWVADEEGLHIVTADVPMSIDLATARDLARANAAAADLDRFGDLLRNVGGPNIVWGAQHSLAVWLAEAHMESERRASRRILDATWALVAATTGLVIATGGLIVTS